MQVFAGSPGSSWLYNDAGLNVGSSFINLSITLYGGTWIGVGDYPKAVPDDVALMLHYRNDLDISKYYGNGAADLGGGQVHISAIDANTGRRTGTFRFRAAGWTEGQKTWGDSVLVEGQFDVLPSWGDFPLPRSRPNLARR